MFWGGTVLRSHVTNRCLTSHTTYPETLSHADEEPPLELLHRERHVWHLRLVKQYQAILQDPVHEQTGDGTVEKAMKMTNKPECWSTAKMLTVVQTLKLLNFQGVWNLITLMCSGTGQSPVVCMPCPLRAGF